MPALMAPTRNRPVQSASVPNIGHTDARPAWCPGGTTSSLDSYIFPCPRRERCEGLLCGMTNVLARLVFYSIPNRERLSIPPGRDQDSGPEQCPGETVSFSTRLPRVTLAGFTVRNTYKSA